MPGKWRKAPNVYGTEVLVECGPYTEKGLKFMLVAEAFQLDKLGAAGLTVKAKCDGSPSATTCSAGTSGSVYATFHATIGLDAREGRTFLYRPEYTIAHEYGHAWTMYHYYITQQKDSWDEYLMVRGLYGNPLLNTSYAWTTTELIADDYRMLFGSPKAVAAASYFNRNVEDPRNVPGLRDWFLDVWAGGA